MEEIKMVDLLGQHNQIRREIDSAIKEVIDSSAFIKGKQVKAFEENLARYLGAKHVIGCGNGTDALQIALMALGLEPGDRVLVPAFTYVATAEVIALLHLVPVMYDVNPRTFNTDASVSLEYMDELVDKRTKAIVPVHLFGQCSQMDAILEFAHRHNLKVVEDCAQALGSKCKVSNISEHEGCFSESVSGGQEETAETMGGCIGDIGCTSFFPTKNLGCMGDGGALITNDDALAEQIRMIANHGQKVKYHHDLIGCNSRLDTLQAAVLDVKLKHLDEYIAARRKAAASYTRLIKAFDPLEKHICTPVECEFTTHTYHQYTIIVKDSIKYPDQNTRDALKAFLAERGIPSMIYYPLPLSKQAAFRGIALRREDFNPGADDSLHNSEWLADHVLSLPVHTCLKEDQIEYIAEAIKDYLCK
ncbi:MAG: DegT/DnrJ/EryC1/StrS family aminotransferase [Bacteroidales bacterium]|nr:DegT/DnrJ/EryC1/StrS family aminotransferase [Bacteroidales bacterium]